MRYEGDYTQVRNQSAWRAIGCKDVRANRPLAAASVLEIRRVLQAERVVGASQGRRIEFEHARPSLKNGNER